MTGTEAMVGSYRSDKMENSNSPLFGVDFRTVEIWDRMQQLQTDFCFPTELPAYFMSTAWHRAEKVLDVGSGNGYYLQRLNSFFPEKIYHGLDNNSDLLKLALQDNRSDNVQYTCIPFLDMRGRYDFIIMRLFLQHMADIDQMLNHASSLVGTGGSLMIIDAFDPARLYAPDLPLFMAFFRAYAAASARRGLDRDVQGRLRRAMETNRHWRVEGDRQIIVSSATPGNLELFRETYSHFIDLVEHTKAMDYDFSAVRDEWERWSGLEKAYTQAGLSITQLTCATTT